MRDAYGEFEKRDLRLVVIGNGRPEHARAFRSEAQIPFELWVDPEMKAYRTAGLRRGIRNAFSLRSPKHLVRAMRQGFKQTRVQGDPWQLGGAFVITVAGKTIYEQVSREAGDHAPIEDILAAIDRA